MRAKPNRPLIGFIWALACCFSLVSLVKANQYGLVIPTPNPGFMVKTEKVPVPDYSKIQQYQESKRLANHSLRKHDLDAIFEEVFGTPGMEKLEKDPAYQKLEDRHYIVDRYGHRDLKSGRYGWGPWTYQWVDVNESTSVASLSDVIITEYSNSPAFLFFFLLMPMIFAGIAWGISGHLITIGTDR